MLIINSPHFNCCIFFLTKEDDVVLRLLCCFKLARIALHVRRFWRLMFPARWSHTCQAAKNTKWFAIKTRLESITASTYYRIL